MKKKWFSFILLCCFLPMGEAWAYLFNYNSARTKNLYWSPNVQQVRIFLNPLNTLGISESDVSTIISNSVNEWNNQSRLSLSLETTSLNNISNTNEIFFSASPEFFTGTGVAGITQVTFKEDTGEILEADIVINENIFISTTPGTISYLGNIVTHEIGHALGFGHGQVLGSTMFYKLLHGQYKIKNDEKAGMNTLYPNGDVSKATLSGRVIGGKSLIGIFGNQVQAISKRSGKIAGAGITEADGSFSIGGLPKNDEYYLYNSSLKKIGISGKYSGIKSDFCESSKNYRGSFFQTCGGDSQGHPQTITLRGGAVDVGNITIRCSLDSPAEYLENKATGHDLELSQLNNFTTSLVGFFSTQDLKLNKENAGNPSLLIKDHFKIDLSAIPFDVLFPNDSLALVVRVINQPFYSPFKANVSYVRQGWTEQTVPSDTIEADGFYNIDSVFTINIRKDQPNTNVVDFFVRPESVEDSTFDGTMVVNDRYFPDAENFKDPVNFYFLSVSVVKVNSSLHEPVYNFSNLFVDNSSCSDAKNTYLLTNFALGASSTTGSGRSGKDDSAISCGSVVLDGGNGSGGGLSGFFIGLLFSLMLGKILSAFAKHNSQKILVR